MSENDSNRVKGQNNDSVVGFVQAIYSVYLPFEAF